MSTNIRPLFTLPVIVAALGYFVDVYDLLLFNIVRVPSLQDLGLSEADVSLVGGRILNYQQAGLLAGGILWGILGDKRGRLSVLFGSIITYSLANIACGFVQDPQLYALLRLVAGVGLAGELGAGITLVSEILPPRLRGYRVFIRSECGVAGCRSSLFYGFSFQLANYVFYRRRPGPGVAGSAGEYPGIRYVPAGTANGGSTGKFLGFIPQPGRYLTLSALHGYCRSHLSGYWHPGHLWE